MNEIATRTPRNWVVIWYDGNDNQVAQIRNVSYDDLADHVVLTCDHKGISTDDILGIVEAPTETMLVNIDGLFTFAGAATDF